MKTHTLSEALLSAFHPEMDTLAYAQCGKTIIILPGVTHTIKHNKHFLY